MRYNPLLFPAIWLLSMIAVSVNAQPSDPDATPETRALYSNLKRLAAHGFLFGRDIAKEKLYR